MANKNSESFGKGAIFYFKFVGFEFECKHQWMRILLFAGICNMIYLLVCQVIFLTFSDADFQQKSICISYINYFLVASGKITALLINRKAILELFGEFREIYPCEQVEKTYKLHKYLKKYLLIEKVLAGFFQSIALFYNVFPVLFSLTELVKEGSFTYKTSLLVWYPFDIRRFWLAYVVVYLQQAQASYETAIIILGLDLCLFSSLLQLCMHFDIINRNIQQIEPHANENTEQMLVEQIVYHQKVLRLAANVNTIFTPSILFSLLSSSFIMCFTGYQLLDDIPAMVMVKAIFLVSYELKQVVITCFLGNRLTEISSKVADSIYDHKWYNGSPKYRRMVLMVLQRSQKQVALNIAGISDVSLQTLRKVVSFSYQVFAVLKTGKS